MFHHSCRVALYSHRTPYHNVDLGNGKTKHSPQSVHHFAPPGAARGPIPTCVTGAAFTSVAVGELNAVVGPSGIAGVRQTLVDVPLAAFPDVAGQAHALVAPDAVHTFAVVEALGLVGEWVSEGGAIIQIYLTVDTFSGAERGTLF